MSIKIDDVLLEKYSKMLDSFSKSSFISSEINTRRKLIDPLIELLGWDIGSDEVILEYPVAIGTRNSYVDYALIVDEKPIVFVEAKSLDSTLIEDFSTQTISYGRVEGVRWVALTNGRILKIFDTKRGKNEEECLVCEIDFKKPMDFIDEISLLNKNSLNNGKTEMIVNKIFQKKLTIFKIKEKQKELAANYQKGITSIIGKSNNEIIKEISQKLALNTLELFEEKIASNLKDINKLHEIPEKKQDKKQRPTWESTLNWVNPEIKELASKIKNDIINNYKVFIHKPTGSDYQFYKSKKSPKSVFTVIMLRKKGIMIRVRYDPTISINPNKLLKDKVYKGWFFGGRGQEREFFIENTKQIDDALKLITQSYELAE